ERVVAGQGHVDRLSAVAVEDGGHEAGAAGAAGSALAELGAGGRDKLGHDGYWVGRTDCGGSASTRGAARTRASASAASITEHRAVQRPSPRQCAKSLPGPQADQCHRTVTEAETSSSPPSRTRLDA